MKILVLADVESKYLWDYYEKGKLDGIDLILSCGDVKAQYLSFLSCFTKAPILYVHGNHDGSYDEMPPEGCICIEDKIYVHEGIRIMGLGGCIRYNKGKYQYTQRQMKNRVSRMWWQLRRRKGIDILLTHAPAAGINEGDDHVHKGFEAFTDIINKHKPKLFVHGHVHKNYQWNFQRETRYKDTTVVNAYERHIIEYEVE